MISAPSEMRCRSMPSRYIARKVSASTSGMHSATTRPVRKPSDRKLTTSTMTTASARLFLNSCTDSSTTRGWSLTAWICDADRQARLHALDGLVQLLAEADHVAALAHADRQADRLLAVEAHLRGGRVDHAAPHLGDVAQAEGALAGADADVADAFDRVELAAHGEPHLLGAWSAPCRRPRRCWSAASVEAISAGSIPSEASLAFEAST